MYEAAGVDRLATWTYRGGYGTSVAAKDALELWDNIGRNYKRVLKNNPSFHNMPPDGFRQGALLCYVFQFLRDFLLLSP